MTSRGRRDAQNRHDNEDLGLEFDRATARYLPDECQVVAFERIKRVALKRGHRGIAFMAAMLLSSVLQSYAADPDEIARLDREIEKLRTDEKRRGERITWRRNGEPFLTFLVRGHDAAMKVGILTPEQRRDGYAQFVKRNPRNQYGFFRLGLARENLGDKRGAANAYKRAESLSQATPDFLRDLRFYVERRKDSEPSRSKDR